MKNIFVIFVAAAMLTALGCQKQEAPGKTGAPQAAAPMATPSVAAPQTTPPASPPAAPLPAAGSVLGSQMPPGHPPVGDPHAGLKAKEMATGTGHKGKVLQVMDAGSYTYLEVEEKGQKLWVAALKAKVSKGDTVEFPDSQPMENFESKSLKRTFDKIFFADALRVVK